jgi:hypothetical protein
VLGWWRREPARGIPPRRRLRRFRRALRSLDECHAQGGQVLPEQLFLDGGKIAPGLELQHLELVDEHPRGLEVHGRRFTPGTGKPAQHDEGHVGLLHDERGEQGGHQVVLCAGQRVGGGIGCAHGGFCCSSCSMSASRKWMRCFRRRSRSTDSRMTCRAPGWESSVPETKSASSPGFCTCRTCSS